ncbi:MAG: hypothetical protein U0361_13455 [Nitrospiraceae bacterium]
MERVQSGELGGRVTTLLTLLGLGLAVFVFVAIPMLAHGSGADDGQDRGSCQRDRDE